MRAHVYITEVSGYIRVILFKGKNSTELDKLMKSISNDVVISEFNSSIAVLIIQVRSYKKITTVNKLVRLANRCRIEGKHVIFHPLDRSGLKEFATAPNAQAYWTRLK